MRRKKILFLLIGTMLGANFLATSWLGINPYGIFLAVMMSALLAEIIKFSVISIRALRKKS